jgi:hypothetical protein
MIRWRFSVLAIVLVPGLVQAAGPPVLIGSASDLTRSSQLVIHITRACPQGDLIQVVAVSRYGHNKKITAFDSGGVNVYQTGGGGWISGATDGVFLATTSPGEPTNAGLRPPATITVNYSEGVFWKAAIAACVPGLETKSGSADNKAGVSPTHGDGASIDLLPSSNVVTRNERLFVATVLVGDAADHWTESAGYKTLMTLQNRHTLNLAYQIVPGVTPTRYLAANAVARPWSAANRSYKTPLKR